MYLLFAELNLIIELCISLKRFVRAITFFTKYSGVRFEPPIPKESFKDRLILRGVLNESNRKCVVPIGLHSDLMQKLCVVLIHLEAYEMFKVKQAINIFIEQVCQLNVIISACV